jgi:hypothetical protein
VPPSSGSPKIKSLVNQSLGSAFIKADSVQEILGRIWRISQEDAEKFVESLLDKKKLQDGQRVIQYEFL